MRCLSFLLSVLLVPFANGQTTVDPPNHVLIVDMGKSAKITIDTGDCDPSWTSSSDDENVATVSPDSAASGKKRTFTVNTNSQGLATVTIDTVGSGPGCESNESFDITVIVIKSQKSLLKVLKKELKIPVKDFKKTMKSRIKEAGNQLDGILDSYEDGTILAGFLGDPTAEDEFEEAADQVDDAQDSLFEMLVDDYQAQVARLRDNSHFARANYGFASFLEYAPADFFSGFCGMWDDAALDSWDLFVSTVRDLDALVKSCEEDLADAAADNGLLVAISTAPSQVGEFTTGGLDGTSNTSTDFDAGSKQLKMRDPKSTNYSKDGNNKHGRIRAKGKADPAKGSVTVTYERLGSDDEPVGTDPGDYYQDSGVVIGAKCKWKSNSQSGIEPDLCIGKWRVTVSQGSDDDEVTVVKTVRIKVP